MGRGRFRAAAGAAPSHHSPRRLPLAGEGDELAARGDHRGAAARYLAACEQAPHAVELEFWAGLSLIGVEEWGLSRLRAAIERDRGWRELLDRLEATTAPAVAEARRLLDAG